MKEDEIGTEAVCNACGEKIRFDGQHWQHTGLLQPRHFATPQTGEEKVGFVALDISEKGTAVIAPENRIEGVSDAFHVTDEPSAEWVLGLYADIDRRAAQIAKRLEQLKADRDRLDRRFLAELGAFADAEALLRRRKTITLENADITITDRKDAYKIADKDKAMDSAQKGGYVITETVKRIDEKAFLTAARAYHAEKGEQFAGVTFVPAHREYKIGPAKADKAAEKTP